MSEFDNRLQAHAAKMGRPYKMKCLSCGRPFSTDNTITPAGEKETQISGFCEVCFDDTFPPEDEDEAS